MLTQLRHRETPAIDHRQPVSSITVDDIENAQPYTASVWLRDNPFFRRPAPVTLWLDFRNARIMLGTAEKPDQFVFRSGTFSISPSLSRYEVNINSSITHISIGSTFEKKSSSSPSSNPSSNQSPNSSTSSLSTSSTNINSEHDNKDDINDIDGLSAWNSLVGKLRLFAWAPRNHVLMHPLGKPGSTGVVYKAWKTSSAKPSSSALTSPSASSSSLLRACDINPSMSCCSLSVGVTKPGSFVAVKETRGIDLHHACIHRAQAALGARAASAAPQHANIAKPSRVFWQQGAMLSIMPLANGGTLREALRNNGGRLPTRVAISITADILRALAHLHAHGVVHRALTLDHIVLEHKLPDFTEHPNATIPKAMLCGFGMAAPLTDKDKNGKQLGRDDKLHAMRTSPAYIRAPESAKQGRGNKAGDVWAAGIALYSMIHGSESFASTKCASTTVSDMVQRAHHHKPHINAAVLGDQLMGNEDENRQALRVRSLLSGLLQPSSTRRLTARAALEHCVFSPPPSQTEPETTATDPKDKQRNVANVDGGKNVQDEKSKVDGNKNCAGNTTSNPLVVSSSQKSLKSVRLEGANGSHDGSVAVSPRITFRHAASRIVSVVSLVDAWQTTAGVSRTHAIQTEHVYSTTN